MKNVLLAGLSLTVAGVGVIQAAPPVKKPNILYIMSDDQGYRDLGCYGATDLQTPNLDKIASEGTLFSRFYAGAALSSPSRASMLTGLSSIEAGVPGNIPREREDPDQTGGMPTTNLTVAKNLKAAGYYTALVGKWHLGEGDRQSPLKSGFDYCFGHRGGCIDNYSHFFYWSGPDIHDLFRNNEEVYYPGRFFPDLIVEETNKIIETKRSEPFFIYCAFNVPHYPYQGSVKWLNYYRSRGVPSPRCEYIAFISTMDECIGKIIAKLKKEGKYDNTVIIFQADQGYSVEDRAMYGGGDAGNLRGCKGSLFEGGIRVPAFIKYAGVVPAGKTINNVAYGVDWYNTVAEIAGAKINPESQGTSLMPLLTGKTVEHPKMMNWQFGDFNDAKGQWIARNGDWKLIGNVSDPRNPESLSSEDKKLFLANLAMDETESENLASKYPEKVAELKEQHDEWYAKVRKNPVSEAPAQKGGEIRLLVRADDMGSFASANRACIDACKNGIARSVEVMVPCAWFPEAAKLLRENPSIDAGVHLMLTSEWANYKWRPLTAAPSLTDEYGYFYPYIWPKADEPNRSIQETKWKLSEIEAEFRAQIEMAKKCIPQLSHLSAHMGCTDWNSDVKALVQRLAAEYHLYFSDPETKAFPEMNATNKDSSEKRIAAFMEALDKLEPGNTYLFIEHPAYNTPEMQTVGHKGYENVAADRDGIIKMYTDQRVMDLIRKKGIRLIGYNTVAQTGKVAILKKSPDVFELDVNGQPTFIKGAVGSTGIELVKKYGGNGIRSDYTKERLDEAQALGLKVLVDLPVKPQRDGFDYENAEAVRLQREKILQIVRETKDHPAVLMWALGNELDHVPQKIYEPNKIYYNMKVWDAVNDLAKAIHEIDPNHPVMTVVGSITEHKINALNRQCPDLDLLGVNEYGDLLHIPEMIRQWEWTRPYMVTEWGPTGFWQMPGTPWGYRIEETSSEKADKYKERYENAILKDKMCLGSFVFLWRQHQEYTHTWFGMFDKEWRETEAVDVMRYEWTGKWPENRAPRIDSMRIDGKSAYDSVSLSPGKKAVAQVWMRDPDANDTIKYEWELLPESQTFGYGGHGESKPQAIDCSAEVIAGGAIRFTTPLQEGAYRLFAAGYDKGNHVAYANIPFYVGKLAK